MTLCHPPAALADPASASRVDRDRSAVDEAALLALLLGRAGPAPAVGRICNRLLAALGSVADVVGADVAELVRVSGLEAAAFEDLKRVYLLSQRLARVEASKRSVLSSWTALVAYVRIALASQPREQFRALFLDRRNQLLRDEEVCSGTVDHAPVYPREVVRRALEIGASALILVHNHPSGDPSPSQADITMTRRIVDGARLFDIAVHDHLIVGRQGTASLRGLGLMS